MNGAVDTVDKFEHRQPFFDRDRDMDALPAELKMGIAELVQDRASRTSLTETSSSWRAATAWLLFDSVRWDTEYLNVPGQLQALAVFLERVGPHIKHVHLTIRFPNEQNPDHRRMDEILSAFASTPALESLTFCAQSSERARRSAAGNILRVAYPAFCTALERLARLRAVTYTEDCRNFGERFARLVLQACAPHLNTLVVRAPSLRSLDWLRACPAMRTLELHARIELKNPAAAFPALEALTLNRGTDVVVYSPAQFVQAFSRSLSALALKDIWWPPHTAAPFSLPRLRALTLAGVTTQLVALFAHTPVVHVVLQNGVVRIIDVLVDTLCAPSAQPPFPHLQSLVASAPGDFNRPRLNRSNATVDLVDICGERGISLEIDGVALVPRSSE